MNPESPVSLHKISYRGVVAFKLTWPEGGTEHEKTFSTEGEAVTEMAAIEQRLRLAAMAGQGLTVNPFGTQSPFINSKDVNFAALKLQPRGLKFRDSIDDYVAAVNALKGTGVGVTEAARFFAEASSELKPFDATVMQAVFEWAALKKQVGATPLFEVLRVYLKNKDAPAVPPAANVAGTGTNLGPQGRA
ncbi:MAG: hypothetical protein H7067_00760 [Burkholderiales bacterium]|nr:hypothetical protein [Opitutaceae bacterium]